MIEAEDCLTLVGLYLSCTTGRRCLGLGDRDGDLEEDEEAEEDENFDARLKELLLLFKSRPRFAAAFVVPPNLAATLAIKLPLFFGMFAL